MPLPEQTELDKKKTKYFYNAILLACLQSEPAKKVWIAMYSQCKLHGKMPKSDSALHIINRYLPNLNYIQLASILYQIQITVPLQ